MRLLADAASGDGGARRQLFEMHREAAYKTALRITGRNEDALDVVQDAFISAFDKLDRFERESGFKTWLLRIVTNKALDLLRARKVRIAVPLETSGEAGIDLPQPDSAGSERPGAALERGELAERLRAAVETLPPEQRTVFSLYAAGDLTYGEIAEILGVPPGTVMSRLYHARRRLRELLPDLAPDGPPTAE